MQPVGVVARGNEESGGGDDADAITVEKRRCCDFDEVFEGMVDGVHLIVEVPDTAGKATITTYVV